MSAPWRRPSAPSPYIDIVGRPWADEQLDDMLADAEVLQSVEAGVSAGRSACCIDAVKAWTFARYPRAEVAALFLVLVAHFLHSEAWAGTSARGSK